MNPNQLLLTEKRKRGRPKGSKNGSNAGTVGRPVGRPRKDGNLRASKPDKPAPSQSTSAEVGGTNCDTGQPLAVELCAHEPSLSTNPTPSGCQSRTDLDQRSGAPTSGNVTVDLLDGESDLEPVQVAPRLSTASVSGDACNLQSSATDNSVHATHCKKSTNDPPKQLDDCNYKDEDDEDNVFFGADVELEYMTDEFAAIGDDDEAVIQDVHIPTPSAPHSPSPEHTSSANGMKTKVPRATMPTWLADEYADACTHLDSEIAKIGRPVCYESGQFTMTAPPLVFSRVVPFEIEPLDFYRPHFFIWLPHLFQHIPCPNCKDMNRRSKRGQPVILCVLGWPQQPRRIVDLEHLVFIIGHRYYCGHEECKKTFQSWSPAILQAIPLPLAALFPFHLTYRCGLTDRLQLHVQYLETVRLRMQASASGLLPPHRPFPRWNDPSGYAGYVPTHRFFRCFYNSLTERHASEMDQHMAMQSAEALSHDHSFKVTGILGKVNGVATFGALHTACNEYGECRKMTLTPTKGHDDCMPALAEIPVTLAKYGHAPVKVLFTDNVCGDKSALEKVFPSLLYDVNPVPSSGLEDLVVPDGWHLRVDAEKELHVAFDLEWPVDREMGIYGRVSLISLAYDKAIYLIPISQYLQDNGFLKLPSSLLVVLRSKRVRKTGVHVKADLTRLYKDCGFADSNEQPFVGALELGSMAKDRNVTDHAHVSLTDLTALVLRRNLPKDMSIRVSTRWDDPVLSPEQEKYAALDVYAASAIFESFLLVVRLMSRNGGLAVAYGHIARHQPRQLNGVNVSKTRVVITVTSVLVPAYLVRAELRPDRQETPISSLAAQSPFPLLCYQRDLRTCPGTSKMKPKNNAAIPASPPYEPHDSPYLPVDEIEEPTSDVSELLSHNGDSGIPEQLASDAEKDLHGLSQIESLAELVSRNVSIENSEVCSWVLGDIWHLMDQFKISIHHGLRRPFSCALRDAIFLPDPEDLAAVEEVLVKKNTCFRQMVLTNSDWVWQRIKRLVPPPEILAPRVAEVLQTYGPLKDAVTGQPLFNDASWEKACLYSDPPGHHFYTLQRTDKLGLNIYWCSRGTNNVKGGIHQNIIRRFGREANLNSPGPLTPTPPEDSGTEVQVPATLTNAPLGASCLTLVNTAHTDFV
ncbi:uncharacterized protein HD556DRAFT_1506943 [Suillus plorans]|uniref:3'-5' exonuclease n=1 Tax=Suillus plorans TaxID=116603 RepID=A0A9P7ACG8_9AGAM|nr:uncharacterized protein HD556DRAFT_1506943 [Suillus plorans]KAG1786521.1 hypothetical protein HD556DRAFT_1506943 [Suillus plorans]